MDIIITTAMIPGKKAPILIENKTLKEMKLGSVIIDLAGASGGNVEGSEFGKQVEIENVIINSPKNLPSLVSFDASSLYSKNIFNFITFFKEEKVFDINSEDELLSKSIIIKNGEKTKFLEEKKMYNVDPSLINFIIFVLAIFVGYFVVWSVTPALHTPLMSVTNAISGIIIVGSLTLLCLNNDFNNSKEVFDFSLSWILGDYFG